MSNIDLSHFPKKVLSEFAKEAKHADTLKKLLEFDEETVYCQVAENPHTDKEQLKYLYEKYGISIAMGLAANPTVPHYILHDITTKIADKEVLYVAEELIRNENLGAESIDVLIDAFETKDDFIRQAINHPNISAKTLIKLADINSYYLHEIFLTGKVKLVEK